MYSEYWLFLWLIDWWWWFNMYHGTNQLLLLYVSFETWRWPHRGQAQQGQTRRIQCLEKGASETRAVPGTPSLGTLQACRSLRNCIWRRNYTKVFCDFEMTWKTPPCRGNEERWGCYGRLRQESQWPGKKGRGNSGQRSTPGKENWSLSLSLLAHCFLCSVLAKDGMANEEVAERSNGHRDKLVPTVFENIKNWSSPVFLSPNKKGVYYLSCKFCHPAYVAHLNHASTYQSICTYWKWDV